MKVFVIKQMTFIIFYLFTIEQFEFNNQTA